MSQFDFADGSATRDLIAFERYRFREHHQKTGFGSNFESSKETEHVSGFDEQRTDLVVAATIALQLVVEVMLLTWPQAKDSYPFASDLQFMGFEQLSVRRKNIFDENPGDRESPLILNRVGDLNLITYFSLFQRTMSLSCQFVGCLLYTSDAADES